MSLSLFYHSDAFCRFQKGGEGAFFPVDGLSIAAIQLDKLDCRNREGGKVGLAVNWG